MSHRDRLRRLHGTQNPRGRAGGKGAAVPVDARCSRCKSASRPRLEGRALCARCHGNDVGRPERGRKPPKETAAEAGLSEGLLVGPALTGEGDFEAWLAWSRAPRGMPDTGGGR